MKLQQEKITYSEGDSSFRQLSLKQVSSLDDFDMLSPSRLNATGKDEANQVYYAFQQANSAKNNVSD